MCGRFGLDQPTKKIIATLEDAGIAISNKLLKNEKLPKLNIPPSVPIITVINKDEDNILESTKWGIKFSDKSPLIFNSRIETIREKPFWLRLFNKNRALVPMDRFYEWKRISKKEKIPHEIYLKKSEIFFVPALYFKIKDQVCTSLITTEPNTFMAKIHNRMPVILNVKQAKKYLAQSVEENFELCVPYKNNRDMGMEEVEL
jgi:putative SOS response-associated peptidase YedK